MSSPAMLWLQAAACAVLAAHAVAQLRRLLKLRSELQRAEVRGARRRTVTAAAAAAVPGLATQRHIGS
jgi:hypothetical protein